jgi:hypothetical protein
MSLYEITNPNNSNKNVDLYVNDIRCNNLNASGANITCDYLTANNTVSILASGLANTGNALTVSRGGINLAYGAINNNYCCQITKFASQIITSGAYRKITGMASSNTYGFNNTLANMADNTNSQITIQRTGVYYIRIQCYNQVAATSGCTMVIGIDGSYSDTVFVQDPQSTSDWCLTGDFIRYLTAGQTVQMYAGVASTGQLGGSSSYQGFYLYVGLIN